MSELNITYSEKVGLALANYKKVKTYHTVWGNKLDKECLDIQERAQFIFDKIESLGLPYVISIAPYGHHDLNTAFHKTNPEYLKIRLSVSVGQHNGFNFSIRPKGKGKEIKIDMFDQTRLKDPTVRVLYNELEKLSVYKPSVNDIYDELFLEYGGRLKLSHGKDIKDLLTYLISNKMYFRIRGFVRNDVDHIHLTIKGLKTISVLINEDSIRYIWTMKNWVAVKDFEGLYKELLLINLV